MCAQINVQETILANIQKKKDHYSYDKRFEIEELEVMVDDCSKEDMSAARFYYSQMK